MNAMKESQMNRKAYIIVATFALSALILTGLSAAQLKDALKAGQYIAMVKAIVCDGCGPLIQKTLANFKELEAITVDQKARAVHFTVKKDAAVKLADLQKALDAAAKQMGMGADYTLSDIKRLPTSTH
jgi:hypothetical protein